METSETNIRWSLQDLLPDPYQRSIEKVLSQLDQTVSDIESQRSQMTEEISQNKFNEILKKLELVNALMRRVYAYADLWLAEDTQNETALNLRDRLDQALVNYGNRIIFFDIWFKNLPDESAHRLISGSGDLKYVLESLRRLKKYTLSEAEERLLNLKDINGIDALVNLYEIITSQYIFSLEINGEQKKLTRDQLSAYYFNASADVRLAAYKAFYRVFIENSTVLAQIYSHRVRDWYTEGVELRGYASPISPRNLDNDLPDEIVETLLSTCRKNVGIFQRYFHLKAKWLGMEKLRRYDIYAPLAKSEKEYSFPEAKKMVLDSFGEFSPQVAQLARRVFDEHHLDPFPRHGKRGGAFSSGVLPELTPWVLINYNGRAPSIPTLAHELGHAVHSMLSSNHSVLAFHPNLPLAETASVFAEMNMTDHLLRKEQDPSVRRDLMIRTIDDAYVSVIRQSYFTLFEIDAHRLLVEGKSFEELADHYMTNLTEQFGESVELSEEFKWEWITVPHFYSTPFYTYAYSFGQLLVLSLYQQYRLEGAAFIPKFLTILAYGGSKAPLSILEEAGIDISTPDFWQSGFDMLNNMIEELTKIA